MGRALAEAFPAAMAVFQEVDDALGEKLSDLIWTGPADALTLTENAQPALMATSLAAVRALESEYGAEAWRDVVFVAGHSLGEYSALAAAGAFSVADAARLLRRRGQAMQAAVPPGEGAMAALIGLDFAAASAVARDAAEGEVCEVANDNAPDQIVVSGSRAAVERAMRIAKERGAKRGIMLPVSAPFHSALMRPAAEVMREALARTDMHAPRVPVVANVRAAAIGDPVDIRAALVAQVVGAVRWCESVRFMAAGGVTRFVELGSGRVLSGLVRRIVPDVVAAGGTMSIGTPEGIAAFLPATAR